MPGPDPNASPADPASRAFVTLITKGSYLAGVVLLVHSLRKHQSRHALVIQYTDALEQDCVDCLRSLSSIYELIYTQHVESVPLPDGLSPIAKRFDDTLTKLRVFSPLDSLRWPVEPAMAKAPTEICFLDADIMVFRSMDDVFDIPRPGSDWIAAHHSCSCNVDGDPWAPSEWKPENCPLTLLAHPEALEAPIPASSDQRSTYQLLNSGVFVCSPSAELWQKMDHFRLHDERVKSFTFPDQNFLDVFFRDHWVPMPWVYNALKTHRYWHDKLWRDDEVRALHYIVDKPWEARVSDDGVAGYKGRDGPTHTWWWSEYDDWKHQMQRQEHKAVLACVEKYVCVDSKLGETRFQK